MRKPILTLLTVFTAFNLYAGVVKLPFTLADTGQALKVEITNLTSPEGPVCDSSGNLYFTDHRNYSTNNAVVYKVVVNTTTATVFIPGLNTVCGAAIDAQGQLYFGELNKLSRMLPPSGSPTVLTQLTGSDAHRVVNDMTLTSQGGVFFTANWWDTTGTVYYRAPNGALTKSITYPGAPNAAFPNGVEYVEEFKQLYVTLSQKDSLIRYQLNSEMIAGAPRRFARVPGGDGLVLDASYNVWVASSSGGAIMVFDSTGKSLGSITVAGGATNCCFGGTDRQKLYITGGKSVYSITTKIKGRPTTGSLPVGTMSQRRSDAAQPHLQPATGTSIKIGRPGESGTIAVTPKAHARRVLLSGAATR